MDINLIIAAGGVAALLLLAVAFVLFMRWRERSIVTTSRGEMDSIRKSLSTQVQELKAEIDTLRRSVAEQHETAKSVPEQDSTPVADAQSIPVGRRIGALLQSGESTRNVAALIGLRQADVDFVAQVTSLLSAGERNLATR